MPTVYKLFAVVICGVIAVQAQACNLGCTSCTTSRCLSCIDGYYPNGKNCIQCTSQNCYQCNTYGICTSCLKGFYSLSCANRCGTGCVNGTCDFGTGYCQCYGAFYGVFCSAPCRSSCAECTNSTSCSKCPAGKYGATCNMDCKIECSYGSCDILTGNCERPCPGNCLNCVDENNCTSCIRGNYGTKCEQTCPINCELGCYHYTGECYSCATGWYGEQCNKRCSGECRNGCDKFSGKCKECVSGNYGDNCELECLNCNGICVKENGTCYECYSGRYGTYCELTCPPNCQGNICNKTNGKCYECMQGYTCNNTTCPSNCSSCTGMQCTACKSLYYGELCQYPCSTNCSAAGCELSTGSCLACINSDLYGPTCNKTCSVTCLNNVCDRNTGECQNACSLNCASSGGGQACSMNGTCTYGCVQNYFGSTCDRMCPTNCVSGANDSICSYDGECLNGCLKDYYGKACANQCPQNCTPVSTSNSCYDNGTCVGGCKDGYSGDKCEITDKEKIPVDTNDGGASLERKDGPSSVPVIAGAVGGVVGLIVIGVVVVVLIWRKRQRKDTPEQSARSDEHQTATTNEYQTIGTLPERSIGPAHILVANPNYDRSEEVLALRRTGDSLQCESDTDVDVLEIDEDERRTQARHQERPNSPAQQEENVYYIGLQDIQKRKIAVDEIADFVASKPFEYFVEEFDKFPYGLTRPHKEARKPDNVAKNRYQGIYAYDETRVKVKGGKADYINANFIDGFLKRNAYIASLGPMKKQMGDFGIFWKMIWQQKVERVVMVTNLDEEGRSKCEKYWPDVDDTKVYGDVLVKGLTEDVYAEYTRRTFKMTNGSSSRTLHHLHFTAWPDKGIPEDVTALIEFRQRVLRVPAKLGGPTLVHCSAGIGRTGTYIALDILIHEGEAEGAVEIHGCVLNMRRNRVNMIQTAEQYEFLHRALVHALTFDCAPVTADQLEKDISKTGQEQREKQFNQLMSISQHVVPEEQINIARNKSFKNKNRPGADIPGDEYRPRLQVRSGAGDYINAVYIDSFKTKRHYIAAQSPLPGTVVDFLSLVYKEDCPCIVSFEHTHESKDVGMYYPADNQVLSAGDFTVSSFKMDEQMDNCLLRRLELENKKNGGQKKTVTHITYGDWEQDRSVPNSAANFIQFIHNVEKLATERINSGPVVFHCLDGAKMCGLFSVVSILQQKIAIDHEVSVVNAVRKVKARRHGAISTQEQFDFCHECVLQYIRFFGIYSNVARS